MCWLSRYVLSLLLELECDKTNDTCFKHLLYLIVYDAINRILIGTSRPFKLWHCRVLKQRLMKTRNVFKKDKRRRIKKRRKYNTRLSTCL